MSGVLIPPPHPPPPMGVRFLYPGVVFQARTTLPTLEFLSYSGAPPQPGNPVLQTESSSVQSPLSPPSCPNRIPLHPESPIQPGVESLSLSRSPYPESPAYHLDSSPYSKSFSLPGGPYLYLRLTSLLEVPLLNPESTTCNKDSSPSPYPEAPMPISWTHLPTQSPSPYPESPPNALESKSITTPESCESYTKEFPPYPRVLLATGSLRLPETLPSSESPPYSGPQPLPYRSSPIVHVRCVMPLSIAL
jgi:hypothetical protein